MQHKLLYKGKRSNTVFCLLWEKRKSHFANMNKIPFCPVIYKYYFENYKSQKIGTTETITIWFVPFMS